MCCPVRVSSRHCPHPHPQPNSHTQAGTKRPTSVWPYQCHRFVQQSFRVHEVSLATVRSIARPTVQQLAAAAAAAAAASSRAELQDRGDKADQTRHIVRFVSLIYLCPTFLFFSFSFFFWHRTLQFCFSVTTAAEMQYWCAISPFSWQCPWGPFKVFCVLCWARSFLTVTSVSL